MSRRFTGCRGKALCVESEAGCRGCGRTREEIRTTRRLIDELARLAVDMDYGNVSDFMHYVVNKAVKKANYPDGSNPRAVSDGYHRVE